MIQLYREHPKALPFLFLTEMWERYGFYVVQGMLVLYMTQSFGFSDDRGYTISGTFTALAYIAPMLGGLVADRLLGFKTSIVWGGIFLSLGYALLAVWSNGFYLSLATIIVGNGLFKPNISSLLGALYKPGSAGRDSGFTLFYIGINLGILLAGLTSGAVKDHFGWHAGFALASIGLLIGLGIFSAGLKWGDMNYEKLSMTFSENKFLSKPWLLLYCFATIGGISLLMQTETLANWLLPIIGIFLLIYLFMLAFNQTPDDRNRMITLNILIISSVVFWTLYWQIFLSVNLYIDRVVNKEVFGFHIPTTAFYSSESIFIILLGPVLSWSWQTLAQENANPSSLLKFVMAIILVGLGFFTLSASTLFPDSMNLINPLWILLSYFLLTVGELLLSPIGLSAVTLLSPQRYTGMMMGIWFASLGFGGHFAGTIAKLASIPENASDSISQLPIYRAAFLKYACIAMVVAAILFFVQLALNRAGSSKQREFTS